MPFGGTFLGQRLGEAVDARTWRRRSSTWPYWPPWPLIEPMLTMRPKPRVFMPSHTALLMLKQEPRLVSMTASHMSRVRRRIVESRVMPALFTRTSTGPRSFSISADYRLAGSKIADVEFVDGDAGLALELVGRLVVAGISRRNLVALVLQHPGDGTADAPRTARHDCNPSGHFFFLPLLMTACAVQPVIPHRGQASDAPVERMGLRYLNWPTPPDRAAIGSAAHKNSLMKPFTALLGAAAGPTPPTRWRSQPCR